MLFRSLHRPEGAAPAAGSGGGGGGDGGEQEEANGGAAPAPPPSKKQRRGGGKATTGGGGHDAEEQQQQQRWDVYDEAAGDPAMSRAVESSLWEVGALRRHHCPHVAALAHKLAGKDLGDRKGTAEMDVSGLLEASAGTLAAEDYGRRLKAAPPTAARSAAETAALTLFPSSGHTANGEDGGGHDNDFFAGWALV